MISDGYEILYFKNLGDTRGNLVVLEGNQIIPFDIKRIFYIYGAQKNVIRGQHANRDSDFVLINVSGSSKIKVSNGTDETVIELNQPLKGVYIKKMLWKEMYDFSEDAVLLVLASTHYNCDEYIRDYDEYVNIMKQQGEKK